MIIIANSVEELSSKIDTSLGLLTNVPKAILDNLGYKFNVGKEENIIEVTILYRDSAENMRSEVERLGGVFKDLGFNFGIVDLPLDKLGDLAKSKSVQYIELPKNLYEADEESNRASCVPDVISNYNVSGNGVLIGFVDSGIDYTHPAFMNTEGTTRIEYIYDLSDGGKIYNKQIINEAIKSPSGFSMVPSMDITGHGTHVVGDACAGGNINPAYKGVAPGASIAMVKASRGVSVLSSQIMNGISFLLEKSKELNMPLVVSLSLSTNNGAHNGSSLLEQYIRTVANLERVSIVIAAGNEGDAGHHTSGILKSNPNQTFNIASDEKAVVINLYKPILPEITLNIINPTGKSSGAIRIQEGYVQGKVAKDRFDIYISGPRPFELDSEIQIIISATSEYLAEGVWTLTIDVTNKYDGEYSIWLPVSEGLNPKTRFLEPITFNTLGIPATVDNIIAVGSYNPIVNNISSFSGRGKQNSADRIRPDLVAPGENIMGPIPNGSYDRKTGTSMAAPQVAGICALIMEWGIIKGNDPYLFGQRLKYYLIKGARRSRVDVDYPNPSWGYGEVCALDSLNLIEEDLSAILTRGNVLLKDTSVINSTYDKYNVYRKNIKEKFTVYISNRQTTANMGRVKVQCFQGNDYIPIEGSKITVKGTGENATLNNIELTTNSAGLTTEVEVQAPPVEYSLNENSNQIPYSLYDITVERTGFNPIVIRGCQVFPGQVAYQICNLQINLGRGPYRQEVIDVLPNRLNGNYPPKIPEEVDKPLPKPSSGVVLPQPVVPEYIIVHQGSPNDMSAPNYKVPFKDYIKNVASCEIYSTWPTSAITANVFCMISFTLNRIYTEWYRGKGKNFDVTSSTAYDHAFNYGRNIYDNISAVVDEVFSTYIRRIGKKQPLLTQYCDGKNVKCPEWLSQWGSKYLGDQGKSSFEILKNYYGDDIELVTAEKVVGSPQSYPGSPLTIGSSGEPVRTIQNQLNRISRNYPLIPKVAEDGQFETKTADAVKVFQETFTLPKTGIVDYATWYKISDVYVGVTRIAELRNECRQESIFQQNIFIPPTMPNCGIQREIPEFYY